MRCESVRAVENALQSLPARQRMASVLRYYEGLSGQEIAAAMGTSVKAVERLLARARAGPLPPAAATRPVDPLAASSFQFLVEPDGDSLAQVYLQLTSGPNG